MLNYLRDEKSVTHGSSRRSREEQLALLEQARGDTRIQAALAEDITVYDAARRLFERQWDQFVALRG